MNSGGRNNAAGREYQRPTEANGSVVPHLYLNLKQSQQRRSSSRNTPGELAHATYQEQLNSLKMQNNSNRESREADELILIEQFNPAKLL